MGAEQADRQPLKSVELDELHLLLVVRTEGGYVSLSVPLVSAGRRPSAEGKDHAA